METSRKTDRPKTATMSSTMTQLAARLIPNKPNRQAEQINHSTHSVPLTQNIANVGPYVWLTGYEVTQEILAFLCVQRTRSISTSHLSHCKIIRRRSERQQQ